MKKHIVQPLINIFYIYLGIFLPFVFTDIGNLFICIEPGTNYVSTFQNLNADNTATGYYVETSDAISQSSAGEDIDTIVNNDLANDGENKKSDIATLLMPVAIATFGLGAVIYVFFLEISNHTHRGYRRNQLIRGLPGVIFFMTFIYMVAASLLLLFNVSNVEKFLYYSLVCIIAQSLILALYSYLCSHNGFLDFVITIKMKLCIGNTIRTNIKERIAFFDNMENEKELFESLRKIACDAGCGFKKEGTQCIDAMLYKTTKKLIRRASKYSEKNRIAFCLHHCFSMITQYLISGFNENNKKQTGFDETLLIGMLYEFYHEIYKQITDQSMQASTRVKVPELYQLSILSGILCCSLENLKDYGAHKLITQVDMEQKRSAVMRTPLFYRLVFILYTRGYYISLHNKPDKAGIANNYFKYLPSLIYTDSSGSDAYLFWYFWNPAEGITQDYATHIRRVVEVLRGRFSKRLVYSEPDMISLLLFGLG